VTTTNILLLALCLALTIAVALSVWRLRGGVRYLVTLLLLVVGVLAWRIHAEERRELARLEEDLDRFCGDVESMFGSAAKFLRDNPNYDKPDAVIERPSINWVGAAGRLCIGLRNDCTDTAGEARLAPSATVLERHLQSLADAFRTRTPCPELGP
jgi:hypothetical protein